ncbi:MAG: hypothetical protein E7324_10160 [Clostridiales bacterium]|nr:hypothetical protein [Clostridiales bacterium]
MFGRRYDGRALKNTDPMVAITPYFMPMRCDSMVFLDYKLDYEKLARYIVEQGGKGNKFTFMELLIAAYVRTVAELPEANRFISNKRMYARTQLAVSFAIVMDQKEGSDEIEENTVKCRFDPHDTIFDVSARIRKEIEANRKVEANNSTLKLVRLLTRPMIVNPVIWLARTLDRYGILPKVLIDILPFHTSLFVANMASIGMPAVKHHIYNFGTTSLFMSIGAVERTVAMGDHGQVVRKRFLPIGICADERICAGAVFAKVVDRMMGYLRNPELLETPPETVRFEEGHSYSLPTAKMIKAEQKKQKKEQKKQKNQNIAA